MIGIIDYGVGNLMSVRNMLLKAGAEGKIVKTFSEIQNCKKLILPGVGHFDHAMKIIRKSGLINHLNWFINDVNRPILGICLGAQIMGLRSEEGSENGLGWINMECIKLPKKIDLKIPHMCWNSIKIKKSSKLINNMSSDSRFYFAHSYYMNCCHEDDVVASTNYGTEFVSIFNHKNIYGCQFHPEKSLKHGMQIIKNFALITENA